MTAVAPSRGTDRQAPTSSVSTTQLTKRQLIRVAIELGATDYGGPLSPAEGSLIASSSRAALPASFDIGSLRRTIREGSDPLGSLRLAVLGGVERRALGAIHTPFPIVESMVRWAASFSPRRVIDMGCGSGRFVIEAAKRHQNAEIVAVELDPVATLLTRANLASLGLRRPRVSQSDYLDLKVDSIHGTTAFIGNPPYVRHHRLSPRQKAKALGIAARLGCSLSGLAGLHVHFLLATADQAEQGDVGCVITSAEWLQVNYGSSLRNLLASRLGLEVLHVLDPSAMAFPDIMTTAAIVGFRVGSRKRSVSVTLHSDSRTFGKTNGSSRNMDRSTLSGVRWRFLLSGAGDTGGTPNGTGRRVNLGSFFRVHRGIATGANHFFAMTQREAGQRRLLPWVRSVTTAADDVLSANGCLRASDTEMVLLCPPSDVDLHATSTQPLRDYLRLGRSLKIHEGYLCSHRRPWWFLGKHTAPSIIATYMTRGRPAFALNPDKLLVLNVLHGLYPIKEMGDSELSTVVQYLNSHRADIRGYGRVYQGGLEKFEPRELEAVPIPPLNVLLRDTNRA